MSSRRRCVNHTLDVLQSFIVLAALAFQDIATSLRNNQCVREGERQKLNKNNGKHSTGVDTA